jgi:hypothetical protein
VALWTNPAQPSKTGCPFIVTMVHMHGEAAKMERGIVVFGQDDPLTSSRSFAERI